MTKASLATKKILIVDDHPLIRKGMVSILVAEPGFEVVGTAASATEALEQVELGHPDLVVSDLTLPDRSGLELIKDLKAVHPEIPVLVVSMHDEEIYAERVLRAGGRGYLMKDSAAERIVKAIEVVLGGSIYVSQATTNRLLEALRPEETSAQRPQCRAGPLDQMGRDGEMTGS